jgi:hypothetical protein
VPSFIKLTMVSLVFTSVFAFQPAVSQESQAIITKAEAETAAIAVAGFCKVIVERMEGVISDEWATQDLRDLSAAWDSLDCDKVFGVDERVRWLVR